MAYELPENLASLSAEELQALIDAGIDAFRALGLGDDSPEEAVVEGERIAPLVAQARGEQRRRETEAAATTDRRTRTSTLLEQMATPDEEPPPPDQPDQPTEPDPAEGAVETVTPDEVITPAEPVTAGGRTSPARRAAANAAPPAVPPHRSVVASLVAAADVPGFATGSELDGLSQAAQAVVNRWKGFPTQRIGGPDGVSHRYGAAVIRKQGYDTLVQGGPYDDYDLINAAANERRLPGGSLVAAGGWCSPSETLYDLCQYEQVEGILDLPEISITRGGIRWTQGPDFGDIYTACGFQFSESEVIAGTAQKTCCTVDCPPFDEIRADLIGLCVKAPLLTQATYPELVRRFMEGALVAQQHKVNKYIIDQISNAAGPPMAVADLESISMSLAGIQFSATGMRWRYRMSSTQSIEVVAPLWLKDVIKMDLGMRQMAPDVSDAAVNSWFTQRNMMVNWVYDFQDPVIDDANACSVTLPTEVTVLLYPAGTWVKGSIDVINVDAVYDSTTLAQNVYTALFVEEGILAVQRCTHTCAVEIPICISGRAAANDITTCLTAPIAAGP